MNDPMVRSIAAKALLAGVLLAAAWILTVRPARAGIEVQRGLLATSTMAVEEHQTSSLTEDQAAVILADLRTRAEELSQSLGRYASSTEVLRTIERMGTDRGLRLQRTDPRSSSRAPDRRSGRDGELPIAQDEFTIEFIGEYASTVGFIGDLQQKVGAAQITEVRITRSGRNAVRATVSLMIFRAQPGSKVINIPEAQHAS